MPLFKILSRKQSQNVKNTVRFPAYKKYGINKNAIYYTKIEVQHTHEIGFSGWQRKKRGIIEK